MINSDKYTMGLTKIMVKNHCTESNEHSYYDLSENHFSGLPLREASSIGL